MPNRSLHGNLGEHGWGPAEGANCGFAFMHWEAHPKRGQRPPHFHKETMVMKCQSQRILRGHVSKPSLFGGGDRARWGWGTLVQGSWTPRPSARPGSPLPSAWWLCLGTAMLFLPLCSFRLSLLREPVQSLGPADLPTCRPSLACRPHISACSTGRRAGAFSLPRSPWSPDVLLQRCSEAPRKRSPEPEEWVGSLGATVSLKG